MERGGGRDARSRPPRTPDAAPGRRRPQREMKCGVPSIGSAAGVALMGQAYGTYTFFSHLKWTWAVALGYAASIGAHFLVNAKQFG